VPTEPEEMVMSRKASSSKPAACEACQGRELVRRITTYPVHLTGPLEGKQIHVGRVASTNVRLVVISCRPRPGRPRWTVMSRWESASSSGSCTELSRPTHAYRKVTNQQTQGSQTIRHPHHSSVSYQAIGKTVYFPETPFHNRYRKCTVVDH